jgi:hypothetical protein
MKSKAKKWELADDNKIKKSAIKKKKNKANKYAKFFDQEY